ncbi:MAG: hypothetical protein R3F59_26915 [Myxococcota bacterium]
MGRGGPARALTWLLLAAACRPVAPGPRQVAVLGDDVPAVSRPVVGGAAAASSRWVVAADVGGDALVALDAPGEVRRVQFPRGYAPSAVALDGDVAAVTLPGAGAVAVVALAPLAVVVTPVCDAPRGVDLAGGRWAVACADGTLALSDGARWPVARELRDVVLDGDRAWVLLGRDAAVAVVDLADGRVIARWGLPTLPDPDGRPLVARAGRRMVRADGGVAVLYQAHVTDEVALDLAGPAPYGTGACNAVARPLVSWVGPDGPARTVRLDAVLPVDLALWPEGDGAFTEPTPVVGSAGAAPWRGALTTAYPPSGMTAPALYCLRVPSCSPPTASSPASP